MSTCCTCACRECNCIQSWNSTSSRSSNRSYRSSFYSSIFIHCNYRQNSCIYISNICRNLKFIIIRSLKAWRCTFRNFYTVNKALKISYNGCSSIYLCRIICRIRREFCNVSCAIRRLYLNLIFSILCKWNRVFIEEIV